MLLQDASLIPSVCLTCKHKETDGEGYRWCKKVKVKLKDIKKKTMQGRNFECLYKEEDINHI